jgi:NADH:ubiquinone oxidoreductase subunit E
MAAARQPMTQTETSQVEALLGHFDDSRSNLIAILQEVQATYYYLPQPVLRRVSEKLHVPLTEIFHVATFYNCFSLEPVGKHVVQVCLGTACHVRGAPRVLDRILRDLKLPQPGTTTDLNFTVRSVRCIGCCGLAPVVTVDNKVHHHLTQAKATLMLKKYGSNGQPKETPAEAEDA